MLAFPILYLEGMRIVMFLLSGFYSRATKDYNSFEGSITALRVLLFFKGALLGGSWVVLSGAISPLISYL